VLSPTADPELVYIPLLVTLLALGYRLRDIGAALLTRGDSTAPKAPLPLIRLLYRMECLGESGLVFIGIVTVGIVVVVIVIVVIVTVVVVVNIVVLVQVVSCMATMPLYLPYIHISVPVHIPLALVYRSTTSTGCVASSSSSSSSSSSGSRCRYGYITMAGVHRSSVIKVHAVLQRYIYIYIYI
jgi:hypothetical protein